MADNTKADQEDNGMEYQGNQAVQTPVKTLKTCRVVRCIFNTDPDAAEKYKKHYGTSNVNRTREYSYITDLDFKEGDFAVVETPHGGLTVVQVASVGADLMFGELPGHKWIIDRVDYTGYQERAEREKRKAFLMKSLANRADQIKAQQRLEDVLSSDPAAQDMLAELKELSNS
ncbi:hypothetical protein STASHLEY_00990 [Brevundimonas phage vB_BpoS-StAshley]|nr:hypothetical protein STASHLEY_00990 [Brevundimonas phage vB_BpoS-StAshley]